MTEDTAVKVAVRIRPLIPQDSNDFPVCTMGIQDESTIILRSGLFTFDKVFKLDVHQKEIFDTCVKELVNGCFDGYNATVLAYGQTGSGKTYTMGTGFEVSCHQDERGIIPRAIEYLFQEIYEVHQKGKEKGGTPPEFKINAQFMEKKNNVKIKEDSRGNIFAHGIIAQCVTTVQEALNCLKIGSLSRKTASTGMNTQSSRSHAIYTLHIKQQRVVKLEKYMPDESCNSSVHEHLESLNEFETITAKLNFVDLSGSERLRRTGATGDRQKESICINSDLLALGNVISALGDRSKKSTHIPYRDSKLTRILQDSLGGNSRTLMIACVSPSDRDLAETLSTLKYANRAKNICNKVVSNKDKSSQAISALIKQVEILKIELMEFKQDKRIIREDGAECINEMLTENKALLKKASIVEKQRGECISSKNAEIKQKENVYEKRILKLKEAISKLQLKLRSSKSNEAQLKMFKQEVDDIKRAKVHLIKQIEEERKIHMKEKKIEITFLKNENIKQNKKIKALGVENEKKELLLQRKNEEIRRLKEQEKINKYATKWSANAGRLNSGRYIPPHLRPRQHAQADPSAVAQTQWNAGQYGQSEQKRALDWHNQTQE